MSLLAQESSTSHFFVLGGKGSGTDQNIAEETQALRLALPHCAGVPSLTTTLQCINKLTF